MKLFYVLLLSGVFTPAHAEEGNIDPWLGLNRMTYGFNDVADKVILKPLARGYQAITPTPARRGVKNFFGSLQDVNISVLPGSA